VRATQQERRPVRPRAEQPPPKPRFDLRLAVALFVVVAVALVLRIPEAVSDPFWQDEVASARVLEQPTLVDVVRRIERTESTPPAWYVLSWLGRQAGISLEALRIPSAVFSAALAALVLLLARRLLSFRAALFAALLAAVGWQFAAHGRELRAYALHALLAVAFAALLARAARSPTKGRLAALAACVALGVLTHYFFVLTLVAGLVWLFVVSMPRATRVRASLAMLGGLAVLAIWTPVLLEHWTAQRFGWIDDFDALKGAYLYGTVFDAGGALYADVDQPFGWRQVLWLAVLVLVLAGSVQLWRRSGEARLWALLAVGPFALAAAIWLAGPDIFNTRNLLAVAPFACVAVAAAIFALPRPLALAGAAGIVAAATLATVTAPAVGPPADKIAQMLVARGWDRGDRIVLFADFYGFRSPIGWYLPGRPFLRRVPASSTSGDLYLVAQGRRTWLRINEARNMISLDRVDGVFVALLQRDDTAGVRVTGKDGIIVAVPAGEP
jgi:hypothetical protein